MSPPRAEVMLAGGYAAALLAAAIVIEWLSAHTHRRSQRWRTAGFTYHEQLDAWQCPEGQHLWPHELDRQQRVMRYRAKAHICNGCPRKSDCTDSDHGREVARPLDPWPHSEAGRFHRVISIVLVALAAVVLLVTAAAHPALGDLVRDGRPAPRHAAARLAARAGPARPPRGLPGPIAVARAARERRRRRRGRAAAQPLVVPAGRGEGTAMTVVVVAVVVALAAVLVAASVRVLREYERAVVFRLGRLLPIRGPGPIVLIPGVDRMVRVDLRTVTLTVPPQEVITRDNVPARVAAVCYFNVIDPGDAVTKVEDFLPATSQIAQTTLRSVLGRADLDQLLIERDRLNEDLRKIIDEQTEPWGIKVTTVEIKDVETPEAMQRAMARQAEAERERRAKILNAEGEYQAAQRLAEAAEIIGGTPTALQLRYLQTLNEVSANAGSTIVLPLAFDVLRPILEATRPAADGRSNAPRAHEPDR